MHKQNFGAETQILLAFILACGQFSCVGAGVIIEGNLQGGEVAKGRWKPDLLSFFQPLAKKAEDALPESTKQEAKKLSHILEHIHTPGCSWDLMVGNI